MNLCEHCIRATFNGYPVEGSPVCEANKIWFWCPTVDTKIKRFFECICYVEGEPRRFDKRGKELQ